MSNSKTRKNRLKKGGVQEHLNKLFNLVTNDNKKELNDIKTAKNEIKAAKIELNRQFTNYGRSPIPRTPSKREVQIIKQKLDKAEKALAQAYNRQSEGVEMKSLSGGKRKKTLRRSRRN